MTLSLSKFLGIALLLSRAYTQNICRQRRQFRESYNGAACGQDQCTDTDSGRNPSIPCKTVVYQYMEPQLLILNECDPIGDDVKIIQCNYENGNYTCRVPSTTCKFGSFTVPYYAILITNIENERDVNQRSLIVTLPSGERKNVSSIVQRCGITTVVPIVHLLHNTPNDHVTVAFTMADRSELETNQNPYRIQVFLQVYYAHPNCSITPTAVRPQSGSGLFGRAGNLYPELRNMNSRL